MAGATQRVILRRAWRASASEIKITSSRYTKSMPRLPMIVKTVPANIGFFIGIGFYIAETLTFRDRLAEAYHLNHETLKPLAPSAL